MDNKLAAMRLRKLFRTDREKSFPKKTQFFVFAFCLNCYRFKNLSVVIFKKTGVITILNTLVNR